MNFLNSNYLKISYFLTYFDNLMRKMDVTYDNFSSQILTKSKPLKIWLSPRVRRCCLHDSQSSTEHISVVFAHFILKFSSNIIFMIYFYNLRKNLILDAKKSAYGKNKVFFKKSISQPFLNFLNSNFLKISYFFTYFDNLIRKMDVTNDNFSLFF